MRVTVSSALPVSADKAWDLLSRADTLLFVTRGLMGFRALSGAFPERWQQGKTEQARILLFGLLPAWKHNIHFERVDASAGELMTREAGGLIKTWDHLMTVEAKGEGDCRYTDRVEIEAGILTPFVWAYASAFYRYRQRRWRKLIRLR